MIVLLLLQNCTWEKVKAKLSCPWCSISLIRLLALVGVVIIYYISLTSQHTCISGWVGKVGKKLMLTEDSGYSQSICATYFILFEVSWLTSFSILQLASHFLHNFIIFPKHFKSFFNTIEFVSFEFTMVYSLFFLTSENAKSNFSKSHCAWVLWQSVFFKNRNVLMNSYIMTLQIVGLNFFFLMWTFDLFKSGILI